jgi:hypothetical protein
MIAYLLVVTINQTRARMSLCRLSTRTHRAWRLECSLLSTPHHRHIRRTARSSERSNRRQYCRIHRHRSRGCVRPLPPYCSRRASHWCTRMCTSTIRAVAMIASVQLARSVPHLSRLASRLLTRASTLERREMRARLACSRSLPSFHTRCAFACSHVSCVPPSPLLRQLNEAGPDRNNDNRLFDSENNSRGGYNTGSSQRIYYYQGSIVPIEWSAECRHDRTREHTICNMRVSLIPSLTRSALSSPPVWPPF